MWKYVERPLIALGFVASLGIAGAIADYAITQGTGTTFGSVIVSSVHYAQHLVCDLTTPSQCAAVSAGGSVSVDVTNANANGQATMANSAPVVIASNQTAVPVSLTSTTITGTVAATQSGTWTVQPGNTANTTPWLVSGSGAAGTAATGVLTIQGIASMTPVQVSQATAANLNATIVGTGTFATQSAITAASGSIASGALAAGSMVDFLTIRGTKAPGTAAANSALIGCVFTNAGVTLTDGQQAACQVTSTGSLHTTVDNANPNGQATMANSSPVVIASNQSAIPVTLTSTTITGTVAATQSGTWTVQPGNTANTTPWLQIQSSQYPSGAVIYSASATGTTGATTATLAASGGATTTYICGFSIRANATAAATGNATVTGTLSGTMNFTQWTAPNASGLGISEMLFTPCYPASASNTAIAVVSAAPGTGGVVSVTAWGYKL